MVDLHGATGGAEAWGTATRSGAASTGTAASTSSPAWPGRGPGAVLERAGLAKGARCLDVGCGGGHVSIELAGMVGPDGQVTGIDMDADIIALATAQAAESGVPNVRFAVGDARSLADERYELVYARFLLSHLRDPLGVVRGKAERLAPGGVMVVEDIDHDVFSYPRSEAYARYNALYTELVRRRGGDPMLGFALPALLLEAGLQDVQAGATQPAYLDGVAKRLHCVTLENITGAAVAEGLLTEDGARELLDDMEAVTADPRTLVVMPRFVHAFGRAAA
jgi:SAM-dependent methyltransferase